MPGHGNMQREKKDQLSLLLEGEEMFPRSPHPPQSLLARVGCITIPEQCTGENNRIPMVDLD